MIDHTTLTTPDIRSKIRHGLFSFAGNRVLKIFGLLSCKSGKRMKVENRVFFYSADQALMNGYRPCGHCMPVEYKKWKMELFDPILPTKNLLPKDGIVNYYGKVFTQAEADFYFQRLLNTIEWKNDEAIIFQKLIITKRKVAWYGDESFSYTYSKTTKTALPWTPDLLLIKKATEERTGERFNSCLLNLYHTGEEGMAWHSDGETDLKKDGAIGSLSFGVERKFSFKHKQTKEIVSLTLEHGSLLVMTGKTQTHWLHRLPPTKRVTGARVNLTFRTIVT